MNWKRLGKILLFPHIAIMLVLVPVSVVFLVYSMVFLGTESPVAIASYVVAAYTLTVWCFKIPYLIHFFGTFKRENKYARRWLEDARLRIEVSLYGSLLFNTAYALLQLGMGIYHASFWFSSLAGYYILLALARFFLVRYTGRNRAGARMREEWRLYRTCGIAFLILNLALSLMVFFMVYWNRTFVHHQITTIAMAAYTFTAFTVAIVDIVKYRKYNSPVYSASKMISLAAACVSMLTLETTMLTAFGEGTMDLLSRRIMLGATGGAVAAVIIVMAIYMIARGNREIRALGKSQKGNVLTVKEIKEMYHGEQK